MSGSKFESFKKNVGYFFLSSNNGIEDKLADGAEDMMWQFRISVLPEPKNLENTFLALEEYAKAIRPKITCKVMSLGNDANNLSLIDGSRSDAADRDQRGKEVCVYMHYNRREQRFLHSPEQIKEIMLQMWKKLEDARVKLSYIEPAKDEKVPDSDMGVMTPFQYSSNKPWRKPEGILHETDFNPQKFPDPLAGVHFSKRDLDKAGIKRYRAQLILEERIAYLQEHFEQRIEEITKQVKDISETPSDSNFQRFMREIERLQKIEIPLEEDSNALKKALDEALQEQTLPTDFLNGQRRVLMENELGQLKQDLEKLSTEALQKDWGRIRTTLENLVTAIRETIKTTRDTLMQHPLSQSLKGIVQAVEREPYLMQSIQRQMVHLEHEQERIQHAHRVASEQITKTKASSPESYRNMAHNKVELIDKVRLLLDDYTKSNSRLKRIFTGHWNRHHIEDVHKIVNNIDRGVLTSVDAILDALNAIKADNPDGSFARRRAFIEAICTEKSYSQKQPDLQSSKPPEDELPPPRPT